MRSVVRRLSYANVVLTLCLFILLGGGAYAATRLPAKSVGTKQLKANAVTGAKIKNGTITGAKIDSRTLATVPSATNADRAATATSAERATVATSADRAATANHAASADQATKADLATKALDADTLGGSSPSAFVGQSQVSYADREFIGCNLSVSCISDVTAIAGVTLRATCENAAGLAGIVLRVIGGARTGYSYVSETSTAAPRTFRRRREHHRGDDHSSEPVGATGTIVVRTPARVISFNFDATARAPTINSAACTVTATALAV